MGISRVHFVTGNTHKFAEAKEIFRMLNVPITLVMTPCKGPEPRSDDPSEVASVTARHAAAYLSEPFFVEDTALFISALNGFPGTYAQWVYEKIGNRGILSLLRDVSERSASFVSSLALVVPGEELKIFTGVCKGYITFEERGNSGFGFDPIFIPEGSSKTFAEDMSQKYERSHRRRALEALIAFLTSR